MPSLQERIEKLRLMSAKEREAEMQKLSAEYPNVDINQEYNKQLTNNDNSYQSDFTYGLTKGGMNPSAMTGTDENGNTISYPSIYPQGGSVALGEGNGLPFLNRKVEAPAPPPPPAATVKKPVAPAGAGKTAPPVQTKRNDPVIQPMATKGMTSTAMRGIDDNSTITNTAPDGSTIKASSSKEPSGSKTGSNIMSKEGALVAGLGLAASAANLWEQKKLNDEFAKMKVATPNYEGPIKQGRVNNNASTAAIAKNNADANNTTNRSRSNANVAAAERNAIKAKADAAIGASNESIQNTNVGIENQERQLNAAGARRNNALKTSYDKEVLDKKVAVVNNKSEIVSQGADLIADTANMAQQVISEDKWIDLEKNKYAGASDVDVNNTGGTAYANQAAAQSAYDAMPEGTAAERYRKNKMKKEQFDRGVILT